MFLDIAIGIIVPLLIAHVFQVGAATGFVVFGIMASLLPDIDIIAFAFRKYILHNKSIDHRSWTHYPIVYVPLALAVFFFMSPLHGAVFALCIFFHFIHDSLWLGWGVAWFWPFSKRKFKFFPDKDGKISNQFMLSWLPEQEGALQKDLHNPHWIRDFYLRPNIVSIVEYSVFILALL